jgi:N-acetylmuramate 1-kinase
MAPSVHQWMISSSGLDAALPGMFGRRAMVTNPTISTLMLSALDEPGIEGLAHLVALSLRAGDTLLLTGELGAGKTTFARALIRAYLADETTEVISPTFSLVQSYEGLRGRIDHFDLYRLTCGDEADELGLGESGEAVIRVIEWPDRLATMRAENQLAITLADASGGADRDAALTASGTWAARLDRLRAMRTFIALAGWSDAIVTYLQGDASTRAYARLRHAGKQAILMDAPRQPDGPALRDGKPYSRIAHLAEDVRPFAAINHALRSAGLSAPEIMAQDLDAGLLLLEDLGDRVFGRETDGGTHQVTLWTCAIDMLADFRQQAVAMHLPIDPQNPALGTHSLPALDETILSIEIALLADWYWPELYSAPMPDDVHTRFVTLWQPLIEILLNEPKGWILRDVHSPNLLWLPERTTTARVGVIDFQDAIAGPWAHDVMSLLQDARVDVPAELEERLLRRYVDAVRCDPTFDEAAFRRTYAIYGALRATRLLGLFVRLQRRDGKSDYLRHIQRNWRYLERNLGHPSLQDLREWYDHHFPVVLRNRAIIA